MFDQDVMQGTADGDNLEPSEVSSSAAWLDIPPGETARSGQQPGAKRSTPSGEDGAGHQASKERIMTVAS